MPLASLPKPQQPLTMEGQHIERTWYMALVQLITNVVDVVIGPASAVNNQIALFDGTTGKKIKAATGTGVVHATSGVYSVSDVTLPELVPATAASRLIGRRSGSAGDWEEVSLGSGLSMTSTAFPTLTASGQAYVFMTIGEPPQIMSDGLGNPIVIPYTP